MSANAITHTPGPWKLAHDERPNALETYTVFYGPHGPDRDNQICETTRLTDARLIAAAPELLSALLLCEEALSRCDTLRHLTPEFLALDAARGAISKAEGKE